MQAGQMEGRKWEKLSSDCLLNILERVDIESLLLDIPFVCKSWYKASNSLDRLCWKTLDFSILNNKSFIKKWVERFGSGTANFSKFKFIHIVAQRSSKTATTLLLPSDCWTTEIADVLSNECPGLTIISASTTSSGLCIEEGDFLNECIAECIGKFKNLEYLRLERVWTPLGIILWQVGFNCRNFQAFHTQGIITESESSHILAYIPNITHLCLRSPGLKRDVLLKILKGCKKLEVLDVRNCFGLDVDEEILINASHLKSFYYDSSETAREKIQDILQGMKLEDVEMKFGNSNDH